MTQQEFVRLLLEAIDLRKAIKADGDSVFIRDSTGVVWSVGKIDPDREGDLIIHVK